MKRYRLLIPCLIFMTMLSITCFGQQPSTPDAVFKTKIIPPSPEAASLGQFGRYPVTLNNGLTNISIPIYEVKSGQLSVPISISYHGAGVKAYDVASCVGLGWSLNAGGAVTRSIMGFPDEGSTGILFHPFPSETDAGETFPCFIANVANSAGQIQGQDAQADIFGYSLGGSNGKFVFKNIVATGTPWEIVTIPSSRVKITGDFATFTIVDLDGSIYTFGQIEESVVQTDNGAYSDAPTAWYVTSIISSNKADTIKFTYTPVAQITNLNVSNTATVRNDIVYSLSSCITNSLGSTQTTHYSVNIQDITFKNGKVSFEYGGRTDVTNARRLNDIRVFHKTGGVYSEIKRFNFSQSYFTATSSGVELSQVDPLHVLTTGERNTRLRLDNIYEQGYDGPTISKPPYIFEYDAGSGFPVYGSTAQDFMGYYNGALTNQNLLFYGYGIGQFGPEYSPAFGANRAVNTSFLKGGVLKKITYPTGGYTFFETEPNQANYDETTTYPITVPYDYELTTMNPGVYQANFTVNAAMTNNASSITAIFDVGIENARPGQPQFSTTVGLYDNTIQAYATTVNQNGVANGTAMYGVTTATTEFTQSFYVPLLLNHSYTLSYGSGLPTNTSNFIHTSVSWYAPTGQTGSTTVNKTDYTGGLRIKSITNFDGLKTLTKKSYVYTKWYYNSDLFSGDIPKLIDMFKSTTTRAWNPGGGSLYAPYDFISYSENPTFQVKSSSDMTIAYEEVEEYDLDTLSQPIGKTVYTFNRGTDHINHLFPGLRTDEEWKRGQMIDQRFFKNGASAGQYILIKEIKNVYVDTLQFAARSLCARKTRAVGAPGTLQNTFKECSALIDDMYDYRYYDQNSYKSDLVSTTLTDYDENGLNPSNTLTQYFYDNPKHLQVTRTLKEESDGKTQFAITKYPLDYWYGCDLGLCMTNYNATITSSISQYSSCKATNYSQYQAYVLAGNTAGANTAWTQYLGCATTFQSQVHNADSVLMYCNGSYLTCVNNKIAGVIDKDKALLMMQRDNVINRPIENVSGFFNGATQYVASAARTDFKPGNLSNSTVADMIWDFNAAAPILKSTFDANSSPYYRKMGTYSQYDGANNVTEKYKDMDVVNSYIWDYANQFPIAEVTNANASDIAYTSFEADGKGNWTITTSAPNTTDSLTGKRSFNLSASTPISKSGLVSGRKYTLSLWAKSGATILVNAATVLPSSSPVVGSWQYYETTVTGSASVTTVTVTGTATIDELRWYPVGAQMTTYTYNPGVGMTTSIDANNIFNSFQYDALSRLVKVKDYQGKILKTYTYHYR